MSQKIDTPTPEPQAELSNAYLGSLVAASAIVLILLFSGWEILPNPLSSLHIQGAGPLPWLYPWILGGGQTIANALTEFSGHALQPVENSFYVGALISVLLSGVLAPTLVLLLMGRKSSAIVRGLYLVSLVGTATLAISVVPTGYLAYRGRTSLREAQAVQTNRDFIINDLNIIAWKIHEYQIVPKALGGGGDSVEGYALPAQLAETEDAKYTVETAPASAMAGPFDIIARIHATSKKTPGAEVKVSVERSGRLASWTYTGAFQ